MTAKWYTSLLSAFFHVENKSHIENKIWCLASIEHLQL